MSQRFNFSGATSNLLKIDACWSDHRSGEVCWVGCGSVALLLTADRKSRSQSGRVTGVRGRGFGEMRERCAAIMTRNWLQAIFVGASAIVRLGR
jgi:hypothetical protein